MRILPVTLSAAMLVALTLVAHPGWCAVSAGVPRPALDGSGAAAPPAAEPPTPSLADCAVAGRVYCSEYGSRFKELLEIVFTCGDERYSGGISDTDGTFAVTLPCGRTYRLGVEFTGNGYQVGEIAIPGADTGQFYRLEVVHNGSYLEFIRDVRNGIVEDDINYMLYLPGGEPVITPCKPR